MIHFPNRFHYTYEYACAQSLWFRELDAHRRLDYSITVHAFTFDFCLFLKRLLNMHLLMLQLNIILLKKRKPSRAATVGPTNPRLRVSCSSQPGCRAGTRQGDSNGCGTNSDGRHEGPTPAPARVLHPAEPTTPLLTL